MTSTSSGPSSNQASDQPVSDIVVVGGGHNALVCGAYLAEAGLTVTVLEGRDVLGGNTVTEELTLPGWHHDSCSTAHVVLQSNPLIRDDELGLISRYGLKYIVTDPAVVFPLDDGDLLTVHPKLADTAAEFARFSRADADALVAMIDEWNAGQRTAHAYFSAGLPLPDEPWAHSYEQLRQRSAWEVVSSTFEHPVTRRVMAWMSFATIQPPQRPGTGALPAAIMAGRLAYGWATPLGGSGALPNALAAHIIDHGGTVETSAWVTSFLTEHGRCVGVRTADGREFRADRAVVAGSHLRELRAMLDTPSAVADEAARRWRPGIPLFAVHFALKADARYRSDGGPLTSAAGGLGSPDGLLRQVAGLSAGHVETNDPWLLMMSSTAVDPDRAPGGTFKFLTVAPMLYDGREWSQTDAMAYAQVLLGIARRHVDGIDDADILAVRPESPTSLAAHNLSNIGGSCHGGEFALDDGTVIPGWLDYRTDIPGLYLTGSTSHPGGSVSGRPGRNTARTVLADLGMPAPMSTP
ncbi:FAD-dependent oxidoreductase [Mycolicibacterium agri]|uniref:Pyridine nucleotide-disulfide oxidoreductase domain-containing protein 2 n=1 Tax=Mycolicibacterium agri TaxID=36811 RepID=A0A2A7N106_MYCAG|nr:NAD(P)/FAD-dependent oxidoreductase [Mycolicibacterium agri]PEG37108.1 FAD-dependent oxidoreductase [Mycolicibacterium agri]